MAEKREFRDLKDIVSRLRGDDGCPWDKEQDFSTIKNYLLEETYEIIQAIQEGDYENLKEELGDVLFQIIFLAELADEKGHFDIFDAISHACNKFVSRHPHVFKDDADLADKKGLSSDDVIKLWDGIKRAEKKGREKDILNGVSLSLPALIRAHEISKRASKAGFDWEDSGGVIDKLSEEVDELKAAVTAGDTGGIEDELGDILFSIVNLSRFLKVNPENALNRTINKFIRRFGHVQKRAGYDLLTKDIKTLESFWQEAKRTES